MEEKCDRREDDSPGVGCFIHYGNSFLTALYALVTRRAGRRTGLFWVFLIILLATWAGGMWHKPFGPTLWGIHWLPFVFAGFVIAIVLVLAVPRKAPRGLQDTLDMLERIEQEKELEHLTILR